MIPIIRFIFIIFFIVTLYYIYTYTDTYTIINHFHYIFTLSFECITIPIQLKFDFSVMNQNFPHYTNITNNEVVPIPVPCFVAKPARSPPAEAWAIRNGTAPSPRPELGSEQRTLFLAQRIWKDGDILGI